MIRILLLLWYVFQPALACTDSNFFMLIQRNNNNTSVSCVTTEEKSDWGISWAGVDIRKIETSGFQNPREDFVQLFLNGSELSVNKAMGFPLPIIMDSRWNGFTVYRGPNTTTVNITSSGINLSLLGPSLTMFLNGSLGTLITVNINGTIVTVNGQDYILGRNYFEWSHLQLSWSGKVFNIFNETNRLILKFTHNFEINLNTATFIMDENSTVVLHEYLWYDAKNSTFKVRESGGCHMLYFAMCDKCVLDLIINNKMERLNGTERKWTTKKLSKFQDISTKGTNLDGNVEEYFALDVRKCHSERKTNTISALFESLTEIKCYSFYNNMHKVISYGNGTVVGLLGTKKFKKIRYETRFDNNNNLTICTDEDKCCVPKSICNDNHKSIDPETVQKLDAHVYCQTKDDYTKDRPVNVSVKWSTSPAAEMSNYFFSFCEDQSPEKCFKLQPGRCNISMWENNTCSSLHLKTDFVYNLLTYSRDEGTYKPIGCKQYLIDGKDKVSLNVTETTENETLVLMVSNLWENIAATRLKLILENDKDDQFYINAEQEQPLLYKLYGARPSATYNATLHIQTDRECTDSKQIKVRTPPEKLMFEEFPALNCTEQKCTIQFSRSRQASVNGFLHLFVINTSSKTSLNVTVDERLLNACHKVYDVAKKGWTAYKVFAKVTVYQNISISDENTRLNFDIQNDNVSFYKTEMLLINKYYDKWTCTLYSIDNQEYHRKSNPKPETEGINSGIIVLLVLFVLLVIASISVIYKKKLWRRFPNYANIRQNSGFHSSAKPRSKLVQVDELEEYVKKAIKAPRGGEDELNYQFKLCPPGQTQPWEYGKLPANSKKHRYKNIIAYDHSRVVLAKLPGDDFSDYMNANYVGERMYIATQGPKKNTINDFWRMVWEQNSSVIIMLTKFVENDKPKCEKYWPDECETYGEITVSMISQQYQADYCCRILNLCKGTTNKQLTHLHYELWPDHGVPDCKSLASFIAAIPSLKTTGPQIVHCSAGCGRTGTLILAQMCLRNALQTGQVDFLHSLVTIRKCRVDLVQNEEQYKVAHLLVLEILFKEEYTVMCDDRLKFAIVNRKADAAQQLRYLNNISWRDTALYKADVEGEISRENNVKNRFPLIIPPQHSAIIIPRDPIADTHSDYINAVLIKKFYDSISNQNLDAVEADYANTVRLYSSAEFIVTQQPLPNTIKDFWRMVLDKDADIIVSLNKINLQDQSSCVFWPQIGQEINPTSACKLRFVQRSDSEGYDVVTLHAESKGNLARPIMLISMKNWNADESTPESISHLLQLVKYVQALSTGQISSDRPIIVTCHDGATASGLFLSLITTLEMVRIENKFDLCRVVRSIRQSRKEFMRKIEQFGFLYDVVMDYFYNHPHEQQVIYSNEEALYANWNVM